MSRVTRGIFIKAITNDRFSYNIEVIIILYIIILIFYLLLLTFRASLGGVTKTPPVTRDMSRCRDSVYKILNNLTKILLGHMNTSVARKISLFLLFFANAFMYFCGLIDPLI
jgi:hypothetical protein